MSERNRTVNINGKVYDAESGKVLRRSGETVSQDSSMTKQRHHTSRSARHVHHRTKKTNTLMRHTVKKPAHKKQAVKNDSPSPVVAHRSREDQLRLERAKKVSRSQKISKFGTNSSPITPAVSNLPVQPEPPQEAHHMPPTLDEVIAKMKSHKPHVPDFSHAIHNAQSHHQPHAKRERKHHALSRRLDIHPAVVNAAAACFAVLLLAGFFAWQNAANISYQLAAARSGVEGALPSHPPAGFSLSGPIEYTQGRIGITYASRTDDRYIKITQQRSEWTSDDLEQSYLTKIGANYQMHSLDSNDTYFYDGTNVTWVDEGIWYNIEADESISGQQLAQLVREM